MITLHPIRKTRAYRVQITERQSGPFPPDDWRTVWAADPQSAVAAALRKLPAAHDLLTRGTLWGWVALDQHHPNGAPLAVQAYRIDTVKEEAQTP